MQEDQIKDAVVKAYKARYNDWKGITATALTRFGSGFLCVVKVEKDEYKNPHEEVCHVTDKLDVEIFEDTTGLVMYLDKLSSIKNWFLSGQAMAALAFLAIMAAFVIILFYPVKDVASKDVFEILKSILSLAAGYFLANRK